MQLPKLISRAPDAWQFVGRQHSNLIAQQAVYRLGTASSVSIDKEASYEMIRRFAAWKLKICVAFRVVL